MVIKRVLFGCLLGSLLGVSSVFAQETLVQTLSEGGCWFEQGEMLKIVSFNDHEVFQVPREGMEEGLSEFLFSQSQIKVHKAGIDLALHCAGHGASLVVKGQNFCAWLSFKEGKLAVRSLGGREDTKAASGLCDGYKWGELLVGLTIEDETLFTSGALSPYISSFAKKSQRLYKIILKNQYSGKENELLKELKALDRNIRYVELNQYQHPVGEFTPLK